MMSSPCAANIGIRELREVAKAIEEAAEKAGEQGKKKHIPPYLPNAPLLSLAQARFQAAQSFLAQLATLPQSLMTMLLALLDSPAYANLTTHFLATSFNPQTPNLDSVKYFSVGARTRDDMSVFHPLWLPKTILDAAEAQHAGKTPEWGSEEIRDRPRWSGHDGLVSVASSKWGEFLGVLEGVDHWELRGTGGLGPTNLSGSVNGSGCVVTQQTINNRSYNYSPNYSVFPKVIRDTLVSCDLGAKVVTFTYVS
jgi:triacylglycerol lipase